MIQHSVAGKTDGQRGASLLVTSRVAMLPQVVPSSTAGDLTFNGQERQAHIQEPQLIVILCFRKDLNLRSKHQGHDHPAPNSSGGRPRIETASCTALFNESMMASHADLIPSLSNGQSSTR